MGHLALPFAIFTVLAIVGALAVFVGLSLRRTLWSGAGLAAIALAGSTLFAGTLKPEYARIRSMKTFADAGSSPRWQRADLHCVGPRL